MLQKAEKRKILGYGRKFLRSTRIILGSTRIILDSARKILGSTRKILGFYGYTYRTLRVRSKNNKSFV